LEKSSKIAALMIGRGGSSLKDKNILPVHGIPLLHWAANGAVQSKYIGRYYISSNDDKILNSAQTAGYKKIIRPDELCTNTAQSTDAVTHALDFIEADGPVEIVVVQHANVGTITPQIIDDCIDILREDPTLSAVVPSHEFNEYHPYRGKGLAKNGTLVPFVESAGDVSANRQDLPTCLYFDHSIWVLRASTIRTPGGQPPWPCMGQAIKPYITSGCLDVHSMEDIAHTEKWITAQNVDFPDFGKREASANPWSA